MTLSVRPATPNDAEQMAHLANIAGDGMPDKLWARQSSYGQSARAYGAERAADDSGIFSWRNTQIAEWDGEVAGMVVTHTLGDAPVALDSITHPILRPMIRLENDALRTREVTMLATYPEMRRRGVATALLKAAEANPGDAGMSILLTDGNATGLSFVTHHGYHETKRLPLVRGDWETRDDHWVLLRKP